MSRQKLYRMPQQGKLKGVCAGIAHYLDIPVRLVRIIVVLSMFFGLFVFTLIAYCALALALDDMPPGEQEQGKPLSAHQLLDQLSRELNGGEQQLQQVERYVTSETFSVRSRFSQL
ncbi:envelope stress response membrane protein PspC [Erwinia amylovora]|uniref:Phage shock protein C n=4 Tax=Erwinia amylovora TaxID=552 RepID=A0A831A2T6_ERWAM|nr:envelope stress response membrane protein PspC [Erwinia amylovora]CBX80747.1 Phage shock protein C [Erwinia amylovora ATCC BAA-2158]CDK15352.1 Phage shock protein C [Erwinia amylovora LA635]CDK18718.1 Phage shock protein C [Erwinia amylovora LA636]CDK22088.1 Phage shock protein C [Erwinia amylovora LA637]ATZ11651.1 envelope stress response membrane protein PspC [Erwinia amylovora]